MTTVNFKNLKTALQADRVLINDITYYDPERYTVVQNEEIKDALMDMVNGCIDVLDNYKDWGHETSNLIEYDNEIYNFYDDDLSEGTQFIFGDKSFFDLNMDQQDKVIRYILLKEGKGNFCFSFLDFMDNLGELVPFFSHEDEIICYKKYFKNTKSLKSRRHPMRFFM